MSFNRDKNTYHISRAGTEIFRLDASALLKHWQAGKIEPTDHYWFKGMPTWLPMSSLPLVMGVPRFGQPTAASALPSFEPNPPPPSRPPAAPYPAPTPVPLPSPLPSPFYLLVSVWNQPKFSNGRDTKGAFLGQLQIDIL